MWLTYFCLPIALGQVLTRLNLDWFANPIQRQTTCSAFKILAISCLVWFAIDNAIYLLLYPYTSTVTTDQYIDDMQAPVSTTDAPLWINLVDAVRQGVGAAYGIFVLILTIRARHHIRSKYTIPEQQCTGCEDCCCSFWCHCCTVAQMARHINDYEHYQASCCSETGLDSRAPLIV
jgi:Cys-rich protein (TIGR01571 family)